MLVHLDPNRPRQRPLTTQATQGGPPESDKPKAVIIEIIRHAQQFDLTSALDCPF